MTLVYSKNNKLYRQCILFNDPELVMVLHPLTKYIPHSLHSVTFLHAACRFVVFFNS